MRTAGMRGECARWYCPIRSVVGVSSSGGEPMRGGRRVVMQRKGKWLRQRMF